MLKRVLGVGPEELTQDVLDQLVENGEVEHQRLEFKAELPGTERDSRREYARDVAAMANGGGGVLVYGVAEGEADNAAGLTPVELGEQVTRLQHIANSLIEPYLHLEIDEVEIDGGPDGAIIVQVPVSSRRPFAVIEGSRLGYYRRTGRNRQTMTEAEVSVMYQGRLSRAHDIETRASDLMSDALERLSNDHAPVLVIVCVPVESFDRLFSPNRSTEALIRDLPNDAIFGAPVGRLFFDEIRPGFKRVEMSPAFRAMSDYGWMEIHDDGAFVAVVVGDSDRRSPTDTDFYEGPPPEEVRGAFFDTVLTAQVLASLAAYGVLSDAFGIHGEILIRASIVGTPAILTIGGFGRGHPRSQTALTRPVSTELSGEISDLQDLQTTFSLAVPILNDVMTAFGWPRNFQLTSDGTVRLRYFGHDWRPTLDRWAEARGIPFTEVVED